MALTDLTRISTAGIATGTSLSGAILHGDAHFRGTNAGINSAIFDSSENELNLKDNVKLTFGDAGTSDSFITFNGDSLRIVETSASGGLLIDGHNIFLRNPSHGNEAYLKGNGQSADRNVELYCQGVQRLETTSTGVSVTGILTATEFSGNISGGGSGISTFYDLRVSNNLTVEGTTTTLDTNVTGVDRLEINANSNTNAAIVGIQSGLADLVQLYDGATNVLTVTDTGDVGIRKPVPGTSLHVRSTATGGGNIAYFDDTGSGVTGRLMILTTNGLSGGGIKFQTVNKKYTYFGTSTNKLTIDNNNSRIGINTDNPGSKLHISGSGAGQNTLRIDTSTTAISFNNHSEFMGYMGNDSGVLYINAVGTERTLSLRTQYHERLVIASDGKIGIGTNDPNGKTHIYESSAGSVTAATDANDLVVESSANVGMSLLTANNSLARIKFGDPDETGAGVIVYNHQNDKFSIVTATGNRMIIGADMISGRTDYALARTVGGYTFRDSNEGNERAGMHSNASNALIFKTAAAVEQLRITSTGAVGISTTSPTAKLTVGKETGGYMNATGIQVNRPHSLGLKNGILVYTDNSFNATTSYRAAAFKAVGAGGNAFGVSTDQGSNGLGGTLNARIGFDGGAYFLGNVGIGSESPNAKFVVSNQGVNGFEFNPNFNSNNSIIASYNRSSDAYSELTLSASQHIFSRGGAEYGRFDASGRLGVNCTPTALPLEVKQLSADGGALRLRDSSATYRYLEFDVTGATSTITARSNNSHGNINIGTLDQYGRTTQLYIKGGANAKVGINTNSPQALVDILATPVEAATLNTTNCLQLGLWVRAKSPSNTTGNIYTGITLGEGRAGLYAYDDGGGAAHGMGFWTGSNSGVSEKLRIDSSGKILIGAGAVATPKASVGGLDVSSGLYSIVMGGEANTGDGTPRANSATKEARLCVPHYTNAEEPLGAVVSFTQSGANYVRFGGGSSIVNAATELGFYTAANTTTTSGTQRFKIGSDGHCQFNTTGQVAADFTTSHALGAYHKYELGSNGAVIGYIGAGNQLISGAAVSDLAIRAQGNLVFSSNGDVEKLRIDTSGHVRIKNHIFINNTAPTIYLQDSDHYSAMVHQNSNYFYVLRGSGNNSTVWAQYNNQWPLYINMINNKAVFGGDVDVVGTVTGNTSDRRLKKNLVKIETPLEKISKLTGYNFDWNDNVVSLGFTPSIATNDVGLIAQDVQEVVPQAVVPAPFDRSNEFETDKNKSRSGENYLTIQYDKIVPLLVEAIKELKAEIDALKSS